MQHHLSLKYQRYRDVLLLVFGADFESETVPVLPSHDMLAKSLSLQCFKFIPILISSGSAARLLDGVSA